MGRKKPKSTQTQTGKKATGYGSNSKMVVNHKELGVSLLQNQVLCQDENGYYITEFNRIDSGLADPNRYANPSARIQLVKKD
jgi:hypothetical protein